MKVRVSWQSCVLVAAGCLASGWSFAQSAVDCSGVADDKARLKCYDEQAARQKNATVSAATTVSPAPAPAASPATAAAQAATVSPANAGSPATAAPRATTASPATANSPPTAASPPAAAPAPAQPASGSSDFGLNSEAIRKRQQAANPDAPGEPDHIVARVSAVATKPRGEYRVTLEDGQVWEETQHSSSSTPPEVGETVTIRRGLLGSFFLSYSKGLALRVRRIH